MKNLKEKIRSKSFWLSIVSGVILILQTCGVKINAPLVNEIVETICALLIMIGIFTLPINKSSENKDEKNLNDNE